MQNLAKYTCVKSQVGGEDRDDQNLHTVRTFHIEDFLFFFNFLLTGDDA